MGYEQLIAEFMEHYQREYDHYTQVAQVTARQCEDTLIDNGIRAIVTFRAKRPDRLSEKLAKRAKDKNYTTLTDIYNDIVDFAGIRIALYFPGDRQKVDKLIRAKFDLTETERKFPGEPHSKKLGRFDGYFATHYRVKLRKENVSENQKHYLNTRVEIQLASLMMHAWSEVEHDLAYKPLEGDLSQLEKDILDELNGLVLVGELALERLQTANDDRISQKKRHFRNHFELADYLYERIKSITSLEDPLMGRVDILYDFLEAISQNKPKDVDSHFKVIEGNVESRPIAEQIIDQILGHDENYYEIYRKVRLRRGHRTPYDSLDDDRTVNLHEAVGRFINSWNKLEKKLQEIVKESGLPVRSFAMPPSRVIMQIETIESDTLNEIDFLRRIRNNLVHGVEVPNIDHIHKYSEIIEQLLRKLEDKPS